MTGGLIIKFSETVLRSCGCSVVIHSSKPLECATPHVNPNVNYRVWVTTTCQCRFINGNTGTTPVRDVGGAVRVGGRGHVGILCAFPPILL